MRAIEMLCAAFFGGCVALILSGAFPSNSAEWASWVQALGSIGAIGVAIYVLHRQNAHAVHLLGRADRVALSRKTAAVRAIIDRAYELISGLSKKIADDGLRGDALCYIRDEPVLRQISTAVEAIPLHDLGSYELVIGVHQIADALQRLQKMADEAPNLPDDVLYFNLDAPERARLIADFATQARQKVLIETDALIAEAR